MAPDGAELEASACPDLQRRAVGQAQRHGRGQGLDHLRGSHEIARREHDGPLTLEPQRRAALDHRRARRERIWPRARWTLVTRRQPKQDDQRPATRDA
jgi:hypothetical protein